MDSVQNERPFNDKINHFNGTGLKSKYVAHTDYQDQITHEIDDKNMF